MNRMAAARARDARRMSESAAVEGALIAIGHVTRRNAPRNEPLDELDWSNLDGAMGLLSLLVANRSAQPAEADPIISAPGVVFRLRAILQQGQIVGRDDVFAVQAALRLIETMILEGRA